MNTDQMIKILHNNVEMFRELAFDPVDTWGT
jgi:hypothetical protein